MKKKDVGEEVIKEILKNCSLYERIIVGIFDREFVKIYRKGVQDGFNWNEKIPTFPLFSHLSLK